jgi:hypothetical protein
LGFAQLWKKPCNPVLNVLQFFKKVKTATSSSIANDLGTSYFAFQGASVEHTISPVGDVGLATGIQSGTETRGLFFKFILNTKSKRTKIKKPCDRTTQFSTGLHCQARNQRRTELVRGYLAPRLLAV